MPPYYTHRKISIALDNLTHDLLKEKERKFRTSLQDHQLFAIVCDGYKFNKSGIINNGDAALQTKKKMKPDFDVTKDNELDDKLNVEE